MKKIVTVVGARPQFIKAAVGSRQIRKEYSEVLVHTGQHYDYNMSELFFRELDIPKPDYNLGISGGSHAHMTGQMLVGIEEILLKERPEYVLVYGDTNSTMAAALASAKLCIPVIHVEGGGRLGTLNNPEEVNRITTDHVSSLIFGCTKSAMAFLNKEGLSEISYLSGDPMYDAFEYYSKKAVDRVPEKLVGIDGNEAELPSKFYYMTCHRQENADKIEKLEEILKAVNSLDLPCIYPVHPRNKESALEICGKYKNIAFVNPVGYLMSIYLVNNAKKIITDSGGLQREAYFARKQCVTVFDHVVWPETMTENRNQLVRPDHKDILNKLSTKVSFDNYDYPFGEGHSAEKIVETISKVLR